MAESIVCPSCQTPIEISEALSAPLRQQLEKKYEADRQSREKEFADRTGELAERERTLEASRHELQTSKESLEKDVLARVNAAREKLVQEAQRKAREEISVELRDKATELDETKTRLKAAQEAELELRKKSRELEEEKQAFELTLTRRLDEERDNIRQATRKEADDERALKDAEKDKLIADQKKLIDELKRKSEQGSQQLQGEVFELGLEDLLRRLFPHDGITAVPKGIHGGDVIQQVHDANGHHCGTILWESKRTKAWSDGWLPKLRDDQRAAKAQVAVIVSIETPKHITMFDCVDGVWITAWPCVGGLTNALRTGLIEVARAKQAMNGQHGKMESLYNYLSGSEFRHRVEGIVEAFDTLQKALEKEKRAMQKIWADRQKQLDRAMMQTAGMYGDLTGIIGKALPRIEELELAALDEPEDSDDPDNIHRADSNGVRHLL